MRSDLHGRGHYFIAKITALTEDPTQVWVEYERSHIIGAYDDPIRLDPSEWKAKLPINRTFVAPNSFLWRELDPQAVYAVGDRVMVMEDWITHPPSRVAGDPGADTEYYFCVIGKWRGTRSTDLGHGINIPS